ncbi:MAG: peptidylprolyl isomerase [Deltaproteobacteria bacterium]|nr:peptidylprolyl isomerase [Deltaproteobacteria bacterium]
MPQSAELVTARGTITIAFARELAPATVANFVALARAKVYDGTPFHRVIADFVAQGGDHARGDGAGGPGYTIPCENTDAPYVRGAVGMAHAGKDTGGSQFFLTHSWQPHLDGRYTLFGQVSAGLEVMDALQPNDVLERVVIR